MFAGGHQKHRRKEQREIHLPECMPPGAWVGGWLVLGGGNDVRICQQASFPQPSGEGDLRYGVPAIATLPPGGQFWTAVPADQAGFENGILSSGRLRHQEFCAIEQPSKQTRPPQGRSKVPLQLMALNPPSREC